MAAIAPSMASKVLQKISLFGATPSKLAARLTLLASAATPSKLAAGSSSLAARPTLLAAAATPSTLAAGLSSLAARPTFLAAAAATPSKLAAGSSSLAARPTLLAAATPSTLAAGLSSLAARPTLLVAAGCADCSPPTSCRGRWIVDKGSKTGYNNRKQLKMMKRNKIFAGLTCLLCKKNFGAQYSLEKHLLAKHAYKMEYGCPFCLREFDNLTSVTSHVKKVHADFLRKYQPPCIYLRKLLQN